MEILNVLMAESSNVLKPPGSLVLTVLRRWFRCISYLCYLESVIYNVFCIAYSVDNYMNLVMRKPVLFCICEKQRRRSAAQ